MTTPGEKPALRPRRPRGVTALAVLLVLFGALLAAPAFLVASQQLASGNFLGALLTFLVPQALIVGGLGLWFLQPWGVYLTAVVMLYGGFNGARLLLAGDAVRGVLALGVALAVLVYLTRPHVKGAFQRRAAEA